MSICSSPNSELTEKEILNFEQRIENSEDISKKFTDIFIKEYYELFPDILLISKQIFLSNIKKNIINFFENIYTEKIKTDENFLMLINQNIKLLEEKYDSNYLLIKNEYDDTSKEKNYLIKYRKHCFYDREYASHNCQKNSKFILISQKDNNYEFVICSNCQKVYKTSFILCKCYHCKKEYYSEILPQNKDINLFPATWKEYHCHQLIKNKMLCNKCSSPFFLNIKTGFLNCINKKCKFISAPKNILWNCNICKKDFYSDAIIYNPLEKEIFQLLINKILLLKNKAHPYYIPCCNINVNSTEFYHKDDCNGILYLGKINDDTIIVCEKCHAINFYERFIWTCPKCHTKFKAKNKNKEDNDIKSAKQNYNATIESNNQAKSLKRKYRSFRLRTKINSDNLCQFDDISSTKLLENNYNNLTNDANLPKPKKYYFGRFKINKNYYEKDYNSKKENKNELNIKVEEEKKEDIKSKNSLKLEKLTTDENMKLKGRKTVFQFYKSLKSSKNLKIEKKENEEKKANKEDGENKKEKNSLKGFRRFLNLKNGIIDRNKIKRKSLQNPVIKLGLDKSKDLLTNSAKSTNKENEEFVSHLNIGNEIKEEKEEIEKKEEKNEKETNKIEMDIKNVEIDKNSNSLEGTKSTLTKSPKVSKIPGMSDDLYSQIINQINSILLSSKIPRFNIEEYSYHRKLGEGSYGIIHCIIKEDTKEKYALKKIIAQSIEKVSEFVKEFELVNICQHPNILKIYGLNVNLLEHSTYSIQVLMEKAERDWEKDIKRRRQEMKFYKEEELISIMKQLTLALMFMKDKLNITHRDIKPQNVLIFNNDIYKLADFGEAKEIKLNKNMNTLRGTELYMSPALYNGLKLNKDDIEHDPFKSDLFSLGFCFIYAATLDFNLLYYIRNIDNNQEIKLKLKEYLKNRYSDKFIYILSKMVELNESDRFDFNELYNEIYKINEKKEI